MKSLLEESVPSGYGVLLSDEVRYAYSQAISLKRIANALETIAALSKPVIVADPNMTDLSDFTPGRVIRVHSPTQADLKLDRIRRLVSSESEIGKILSE